MGGGGPGGGGGAGAGAGRPPPAPPPRGAFGALASVYRRYRDRDVVQRFLAGVRPVVLALLALVAWDFWPAAMQVEGLRWGVAPLWAILVAALVGSWRTDVHPAVWSGPGGGRGGLLCRGRGRGAPAARPRGGRGPAAPNVRTSRRS